MQSHDCISRRNVMHVQTLVARPQINHTRISKLVLRNHPDWVSARTQSAIAEYERFLMLCKEFPGQKIAAPHDIDEVWHAHMLDSVHYMKDCDLFFGYYLHHDPCIGESDLDSVAATLDAYRSLFGEPPASWMDLMTCANPGGGCGSITASAK